MDLGVFSIGVISIVVVLGAAIFVFSKKKNKNNRNRYRNYYRQDSQPKVNKTKQFVAPTPVADEIAAETDDDEWLGNVRVVPSPHQVQHNAADNHDAVPEVDLFEQIEIAAREDTKSVYIEPVASSQKPPVFNHQNSNQTFGNRDIQSQDTLSKSVHERFDHESNSFVNKTNPVGDALNVDRGHASVKPKVKSSEIFVISLIAPISSPFESYNLLQALMGAGLCFGEMDIFHRFEKQGDDSNVLFSLASITSPGTFNMQKIGEISCKGLTMFFDAANVDQPQVVLDMMIEAAYQLADDLGGQLREGQSTPWSDASVQKFYNRLKEWQLDSLKVSA